MTLANISPRKRDKVLRKYSKAAEASQIAERRASEADNLRRLGDTAEVLAARCPSCGYTYDVARGDEHEGFAAGTAWADIPDGWCCPDCGVREKVDFVEAELESGLTS